MLLSQVLPAFPIFQLCRVLAHPASISKPLVARQFEQLDTHSHWHWPSKRSESFAAAATAPEEVLKITPTDAAGLGLYSIFSINYLLETSGHVSVPVKSKERGDIMTDTASENKIDQNAKAADIISEQRGSRSGTNPALNSGETPNPLGKSIKDPKSVLQRVKSALGDAWKKTKNAWNRLWEFLLGKNRKATSVSGTEVQKAKSTSSAIKKPENSTPAKIPRIELEDQKPSLHKSMESEKVIETNKFVKSGKENKVFPIQEIKITQNAEGSGDKDGRTVAVLEGKTKDALDHKSATEDSLDEKGTNNGILDENLDKNNDDLDNTKENLEKKDGNIGSEKENPFLKNDGRYNQKGQEHGQEQDQEHSRERDQKRVLEELFQEHSQEHSQDQSQKHGQEDGQEKGKKMSNDEDQKKEKSTVIFSNANHRILADKSIFSNAVDLNLRTELASFMISDARDEPQLEGVKLVGLGFEELGLDEKYNKALKTLQKERQKPGKD